MTQYIAIYVRVSTAKQDHRSQLPDLERWGKAYADGTPVKWYKDKASGTTMDRPAWKRLEADIAAGKVAKVVVWRLDRLGRTASGLTALFEDLQNRKINLVSVRDGIDLETPAGRLMANVLASIAAYETEVRGERVAAGIERARAEGKTWGGRKVGTRVKRVEDKMQAIRDLAAKGYSKSAIARQLEVSRPTVTSVLSAP